MFDWKQILKGIIGVIVPVIYSLIVASFPDFPLADEQFLELILWAVGLLIGGWQLNNARKVAQLKKFGKTKIAKILVKKV